MSNAADISLMLISMGIGLGIVIANNTIFYASPF